MCFFFRAFLKALKPTTRQNIRQHNREALKVTAFVLNTGEAGREAFMVTAVVLNTGQVGREALILIEVVLNNSTEQTRTWRHKKQNHPKPC